MREMSWVNELRGRVADRQVEVFGDRKYQVNISAADSDHVETAEVTSAQFYGMAVRTLAVMLDGFSNEEIVGVTALVDRCPGVVRVAFPGPMEMVDRLTGDDQLRLSESMEDLGFERILYFRAIEKRKSK